MSLATMMESVGALYRPTVTDRDTRKGSVMNYGTEPILSGFQCSVQSASPSIMQSFAQQQTKVSNTIFTYEDIDSQVNDKLLVQEDAAVPGSLGRVRTFLVVGDSDVVTNRTILGASLWATQAWEQV